MRTVELLPTPTTEPTTGNGHARHLGGEVRDLLPTPRTTMATGASPDTARDGGPDLQTAVAMLPTPAARDYKGPGAGGQQGGMDLPAALALLPTPTATDCTDCTGSRGHKPDGEPYSATSGVTLTDAVTSMDWGRYADAIARWEPIVGRPVPYPKDDRGRLAPELPEWMMGLPAGWVTDVLKRRPALRVIGNGVVWLQAAAAIWWLLHE